MLLEFMTKNYKSFAEETIFSMIAVPEEKGLDYSMMNTEVAGQKVRGLSASVLYGPNAAGKTNIIGAMDTFRAIVLRGNIRNSEEKSSANPAASMLELIPNHQKATGTPVCFSIDFLEEDRERPERKFRIRYNLEIDLGTFLDSKYPRKILRESFEVNGERIFHRADDLTMGNLKAIKTYLPDVTESNTDNMIEIAQNSLQKEELFLANGFKLIFSQKFARLVLDWFANKFMVICRADSMQLNKRYIESEKKAVYIDDTTDQAIKLFGIHSNPIGYTAGEKETEVKLYSILKNRVSGENTAVPADIFESYGTIRFIHMFPLVVEAIQTGGTLVVDEFDASIHPKALMSIINVFHNDDVNIHHAQLIFNTHNPVFLNANLFRRDEIKFVERDGGDDQSTLYSLADFDIQDHKKGHVHEDYMRDYFVSRYGAVKDIDFTPIFEKILE